MKNLQTLFHKEIFNIFSLFIIFDNFLKIMWKCSQDVADADFSIGCNSAPPHPVRCPAKLTTLQ